MNLDKQTGISIMKINNKLDSGPICNSYKLDISNNENAEIISNKLSLLAAEKILDNIDEILDDKLNLKNKIMQMPHMQIKLKNQKEK